LTGYQDLTPLPKTTFLGLGYKARNGKDSAASFIHQAFPGRTLILRYADALKSYARVAYGMTKKDGPLLQYVGTDVVRAKDADLWVRTLYWTAEEQAPEFVIVPDVRFPNEAEFIKGMGGYLIKVSRLNADGSPFVAADRDPNHTSETALDGFQGWDEVIQVPDGALDLLRMRAIGAFTRAALR
jgi:hypothetical protein